jgi:hypothetical protein
MGKRLCLLVALEALFCIAGSPRDVVAERLEHRWIYALLPYGFDL